MLKAFIVEDEPLAREELKYLLLKSKQVHVIGEADCLEDALTEITKSKPDLVFLDIGLAEDSGLHLAKQLLDFNPAPAIVFATAYDEYALQAFELNALDYLVKPFDEDRLQQTLEKIQQISRIKDEKPSLPHSVKTEANGRIAIPVDERIVLLEQQTIVYLESFEGKCKIKTADQEYIVSDALVVLEKRLNHTEFMRVHRSYIVNVNYIMEIHPWFNSTYNLKLKDLSKRIPVSRTYVKDFKRHIGF